MDDHFDSKIKSLPTFAQVMLALFASGVIVPSHYLYTHYFAQQGDAILSLFLSLNFGLLFSREIAEKVGSTPLALFWIIFSLLIFGAYYITTNIWETTKNLVSLEAMEIGGNIDEYNRYRFKRLVARTGIVALYFIPYVLAIFVLMPVGDSLTDYFLSVIRIDSTIWRQILAFIPAVVMWSGFLLMVIYLHNLAVFSQRDIEIEEEHNAVLEKKKAEMEEDGEN